MQHARSHVLRRIEPRLGRLLLAYALGIIVLGTIWTAQAQSTRLEAHAPRYVHDVWQTEDGLPHNAVHAILQTRDGYLWLGTAAGLVRFDGVRFTPAGGEAPTLASGYIWALHQARDGTLWIGSGSGLTSLREGRATTYTAADGLGSDFVRAVLATRDGTLWVGTYGGGLSSLRDGRFTTYTTADGLPHDDVFALLEDRDGTLWIGTGAGLARFRDGRFTPLPTGPAGDYANVFALLEDGAGSLWVGTGQGLSRYQDGRFVPYPGSDQLGRTAIRSLFEDRAGNAWVGTEAGGLFRLAEASHRVFTAASSLSHDDVRALFEDAEGSLWVGTNGGGLNRLKRAQVSVYGTDEGLAGDVAFSVLEDRTGRMWIGTNAGLSRFDGTRFVHFTARDGLPSETVFALCEDRAGTLWVGTAGGGLSSLRDGRFTTYTTADGLAHDDIFALYETRDGTLWIGTGAGLNRQRGSTFDTFTSADGLAEGIVVVLHEARDGTLWIGTDRGLSRYRDGTFTTFTSADGLPSSHIRALYQDQEGTLWIGTRGGLAWRSAGTFHAVSTRQGLVDDVVYQILEDDRGNLWMSGNKGIFRVAKQDLLDVGDGRARRIAPVAYGKADGMRSSEGNGGNQPAGWKSRDGRLWFPTHKGVVVIDPGRLQPNTLPPPVHVEQLLANDEPVPLRGGVALAPGTDRLEFHYTGLSFLAPAKVRFRHRLEGFDADWIDAGTRRTATYTNLPPGSYTFRVLASNDDGVWNETGAGLAFTLRPYFYQTPWFAVLCALALAAAGAGAYRLRVRRMRAREDTLVHLVEERTRSLLAEKQKTEAQARQLAQQADKLREIDRLKSSFFANLSHEFRTPLTLILGPVEDLRRGTHGRLSPDAQAQLDVLETNAQRLLRLINQLLDLSKLEAGMMKLEPAWDDVVPFLQRIVQAFSPLADRKQIHLQLVPAQPSVYCTFDPDKLDKIVYNLLSNALKFTPEGGKVRVTVDPSEEAGFVVLVVKDTGPGIAAEVLPHLFERFRQAGRAADPDHPGTGLGLALTKELVELHGGRIEVESEPGFGSTFSVHLPVGTPAPEAPASPEARPAVLVPPEKAPTSEPMVDVPVAEEPVSAETPGATVLVVEDNPQVRAYLRQHLQPAYRVVEAADGRAAFEQAVAASPDLIISDVMMPDVDGYALTRRLKEDDRTRHIPVILLTARASEESKLEGLATGADDYLYKPFSMAELTAKVHNLIATRRVLRDRYSREVVVQPTGVSVPSADEAFLEQALGVVEEHIDRAEFGVGDLADALGLSPRQLQRRLRAVAGMSPLDFIRHIRLERAAQLLRQQAGTVAEVAYAVGFSKPSYFSEVFRKNFGKPPSEYAEEAAEDA